MKDSDPFLFFYLRISLEGRIRSASEVDEVLWKQLIITYATFGT